MVKFAKIKLNCAVFILLNHHKHKLFYKHPPHKPFVLSM